MGEKEGTNEASLDGIAAPATNNLVGGAMKMSGAEGIIIKCPDETERVCRNLGQVEENSLSKGGENFFPWDFQSGVWEDFSSSCSRNRFDRLRDHNYLTM
jgi:hypothetical protein